MSSAQIDFDHLKVKGEGFCIGGRHPEPPIDKFPLLAWTHNHPKFGKMTVHLEDHKASVEDIAIAFAERPDFAAIATKFGTTEEHARQAVDYAVASSFLGV